MLVARFSDNITADIARDWSAWMLPNLAGTREECVQDAIEHLGLSEGRAERIVKEFPEHPGSFGCVHHDGLSCYLLDADDVEGAIKEAKGRAHDGSGYGVRTIGKVELVATIRKEDIGSARDLHILSIEDYGSEL